MNKIKPAIAARELIGIAESIGAMEKSFSTTILDNARKIQAEISPD